MPICKGKTLTGSKCKKPAAKDCEYCKIHIPKELPSISEEIQKTPPPEAEAPVVITRTRRTRVPITNVIITRQVSIDIANPTSARPIIDLGLVSPPANVRPATRLRARGASDVGGAYCPIAEHHGLGGINGSSVDETSHVGGWLGMLRSLALTEEAVASSTNIIDFERLSRLAALHKSLSTCCEVGCNKDATLGAHVWMWHTSLDTPTYDMKSAYIVPSCSEHNARKYDRRFGAAFECKKDTPAMKMIPRSDYSDYIQK